MRKLRGFFIDVDNGKAEVREIIENDTNCQPFYELIGCDYIDHAVRRIGGKIFDIIVDDEGLLKNRLPSALSFIHGTMLVGNLFIVKGEPDEEGYWQSLSDDEIEHLKKYVRTVGIKPQGQDKIFTNVIVGVEYC